MLMQVGREGVKASVEDRQAEKMRRARCGGGVADIALRVACKTAPDRDCLVGGEGGDELAARRTRYREHAACLPYSVECRGKRGFHINSYQLGQKTRKK